ncbi:type VI secretion IcmF C-terminal domain-containing protein, partial [Psychroserpens luteolus]|uniref:type VI secretion IcmF C-terminal domain-containing protein n=1 Tax=Psychroserpens luteolus TaxID=2855840 RepID=UPI001E520313
AFFERAMTASQALFNEAGQMTETMTLAALAERGNTVFALGGNGVPVRATGQPASLNWPGPNPSLGVEVSFREGSEAARVTLPGPWGLQRLLDSLRLRFRDGGQRVLIDIRTDEGRV